MSTQNTPLPWGVKISTLGEYREIEILSANEQTIADNSPDSPTPISEADAILIVRAVNNHAALVGLVCEFMHETQNIELFRRARGLLHDMEGTP